MAQSASQYSRYKFQEQTDLQYLNTMAIWSHTASSSLSCLFFVIIMIRYVCVSLWFFSSAFCFGLESIAVNATAWYCIFISVATVYFCAVCTLHTRIRVRHNYTHIHNQRALYAVDCVAVLMVNMNSPKPRASSSRQRPSCLHYSHIDDTLPLPPSLCTHNAPTCTLCCTTNDVLCTLVRVYTEEFSLDSYMSNTIIVLYCTRDAPFHVVQDFTRIDAQTQCTRWQSKKKWISNLCSRLNVEGIFSATLYLRYLYRRQNGTIQKPRGISWFESVAWRHELYESQTENVVVKITIKCNEK